MSTVRRVGAFLEVLDKEGCCHLRRRTTIQAISDTFPLQNETLITAAGHTMRVPLTLDKIVIMVADSPRGGVLSLARRPIKAGAGSGNAP